MHDLRSIIAFRDARGRQRVVVDANLLILLLVGFLDPDHIPNCNRLNAFTKEDYFLLIKILENFQSELVITPHVVAELSNMSMNKMGLGEKKLAYFNMMVEQLKNFHEEHITLHELLGLDIGGIINLGFSDLGVIETARKINGVILSNDFDMVVHALSRSVMAINFTNIRTAGV